MEEVAVIRFALARSRLVTRRDGSHRCKRAQWRRTGWRVVWRLQRACLSVYTPHSHLSRAGLSALSMDGEAD